MGNDGNGISHSGDSMIVDPVGEIIYSKSYEEAVFTTALKMEKLNEIRRQFPFLNDGDNFSIH